MELRVKSPIHTGISLSVAETNNTQELSRNHWAEEGLNRNVVSFGIQNCVFLLKTLRYDLGRKKHADLSALGVARLEGSGSDFVDPNRCPIHSGTLQRVLHGLGPFPLDVSCD